MKQFSIRDLLVLAVVVALAVGWWLDRRPRAALYQMQVSNGSVYVMDTTTGRVTSQHIMPNGGLPSEMPLPAAEETESPLKK
jgi:hypothetical protein